MNDVFNPNYWVDRISVARGRKELWKSVYECHKTRFDAIEEFHRKQLADWVLPNDDVLDIGCGYGRLLSMLPNDWKGNYVGIDFCPEFIRIAKEQHPGKVFLCIDMRQIGTLPLKMDVAVCLSIKGMVERECGVKEWMDIELALRLMCQRVLTLEYGDLQWQDA